MQTAEDKLRAFARELFKDWPETLGVDGFQLQDLAEKHGLLKVKEPTPLEPCSETCACASYYGREEMAAGGAICYVRTELLTGASGVAPGDGGQNDAA